MVAKNTVANTQQKRLSIGIVGGGIGGVAFAVALSRDSQLDVQLFEAAPQFSEIGAGVSPTPATAPLPPSRVSGHYYGCARS